ncbi:hypothetical protein B484DRAFT_40344 [Ochromonadaceae sp. CCMP2298]|nr:hypothetical protein B484DRAFT_40344 [Ochromonadaceae sp. CCMP2298]
MFHQSGREGTEGRGDSIHTAYIQQMAASSQQTAKYIEHGKDTASTQHTVFSRQLTGEHWCRADYLRGYTGGGATNLHTGEGLHGLACYFIKTRSPAPATQQGSRTGTGIRTGTERGCAAHIPLRSGQWAGGIPTVGLNSCKPKNGNGEPRRFYV